MSAIFFRKHFNIRNLRKFLVHSVSHNSNLRVTNPCLHRVVRHECLSNLAHNYKPAENSNITEKNEARDKDSIPRDIDEALKHLDNSVRLTGRVFRKDVEETFSMISYLGDASTKTQSLYLLRCCGMMRRELPKTRVELADKIWKKLQNLGCQFEISHYNALLRVYVENDHQFFPSDFLTSLESNGIEPNRTTFLLLIQKYCKEGNLDGSSEVLQFMQEKGLPICENVFNALITGHMNANDVSGAKDIFDVMKSSNLSPSGASYTALACGFAKNGDIDGIRSTLQDAQDNSVYLSTDNYLSIISSLPSDEHLTFIDEIIGLMGDGIHYSKQEVINIVIDLVNKNLCESAYKLVLAISDSEERSTYSTNIFLQQVIRTKQPLEKVVRFCEEINSKGLNNFALFNCAKFANESGQFDLALSLFEVMLQKGIPVRTSNFWNMLEAKNSEKEILATLKTMFQLGVPADFTTFASYVFPFMNITHTDHVLEKIKQTGQTGIEDPLFHYYCYHGYSEQAAYLTRKYPVAVLSSFNFEKFVSSHLASVKRDSNSSFYEVLSFILKNISKSGKNSNVHRGTILANLIELSPSVFQMWLKNPEVKNLPANDVCLDVCYNVLKERNPRLLVHLRDLERSLFTKKKSQPKLMTIEQEDAEIERLKENGLPLEPFLQGLVVFHIREKNNDRVYQLIPEMEKLGFIYTPFTYAQLFYFHKLQGDLEATGNVLKALRENHPNFLLDTAQVLEYAMRLIQFSKPEEALEVIRTECKELRINGSKDFLIKMIKRLFDVVIETGDMNLIRNIQSSLVHHSKDLKNSKVFMEPLIKMHLFRNDLDGAVQEFKSIAVDSQSTPYLLQLLKACIVADDHMKVEAVIDSASAVSGRIPVLHELFHALIESDRKEKALKVLLNLGPKVESAYLENMAERYCFENRASELKDFLFTIVDARNIDHANLFTYLFNLYDNQNDYKKALELYNTIRRQGLFVVNDKIKYTLMKLCVKNNVEVPSNLSIENRLSDEGHAENQQNGESAITRISDASIEEFHNLLEKEDVFQAVEKLNSMKKGFIRSIPDYDMTQFIKLVVEKNLVNELSQNVQAMSYIIDNVNAILTPLYSKYSEAGDIESMNQLAKFLPDFSLKASSFNGYIAKAYLACGKEADLLKEMENRYQAKNKLFSATSFFKILSCPDLKERAINLAKKYYECKFETPIALVWAHYAINENYDAANELEKQYSVLVDKADTIVLRAIKENENVTLGRMYIERLNKLNVRLRVKQRAYGTLLEVLVLKEKYSEAADLMVETNEKGLNLEKHFRSTLVILKNALERENKQVPFTIPAEESIITA